MSPEMRDKSKKPNRQVGFSDGVWIALVASCVVCVFQVDKMTIQ